MSYARFSNADVYIYEGYNGLVCCGCWLKNNDVIDFGNDIDNLISHLNDHREAGHNVPDFAYEGLEEDREYFEEKL